MYLPLYIAHIHVHVHVHLYMYISFRSPLSTDLFPESGSHCLVIEDRVVHQPGIRRLSGSLPRGRERGEGGGERREGGERERGEGEREERGERERGERGERESYCRSINLTLYTQRVT